MPIPKVTSKILVQAGMSPPLALMKNSLNRFAPGTQPGGWVTSQRASESLLSEDIRPAGKATVSSQGGTISPGPGRLSQVPLLEMPGALEEQQCPARFVCCSRTQHLLPLGVGVTKVLQMGWALLG